MTKKTSPAYRASKEETIPINKLHPFSNHPFHIRHDLEFSELVDSITRTTKVDVVPFEDVTADCAAAEGDGTLAAWKKAHRKAFAAACEEIGMDFDESMKCVCEYFDVVYRADGQ